MSREQLVDLLMYLRISTLLPLLTDCIEAAAPEPSITILRSPPRPASALQRRLRVLSTVPGPVWLQLLFSFVRIGALTWWLTRSMRWDDASLWIIVSLGGGWWIGEATQRIQDAIAAHRRLANPVAIPGEAPREPGVLQLPGQPPAARGLNPRRANPTNVGAQMHVLIPLIHLDVDSRQLHLRQSDTHAALETLDSQLGAWQREAQRSTPPHWIQTQIILPVVLWFITLIPEFETIRARAIRRRERAMRVLVGEMSTAASPTTPNVELPGSEPQARPPRAQILPPGLSQVARNYYTRVLARGEGIDWEEEREAQRALGVGDEDANEGDGMRLRML